jgi:hypothetical protein
MTHRVRKVILVLAALLASSLAWAEQKQAPAVRPNPLAARVVKQPRPGTLEAAKWQPSLKHRSSNTAFTRSPSGLYLPDRRIVVPDKHTSTEQGRWIGQRYAVARHLKRKGARPAPQPYQQLLKKVRKRANYALSKQGLSLSSWKMLAIEGGSAKSVNAAAWSGGVITINRPLIDLAYQLAQISRTSTSPLTLDRQLRALVRYRSGKGPKPDALTKAPKAGRNAVAESIVAGVVLHEMGHATLGHVALKKRELWVPGKKPKVDYAKKRSHEREADKFSTVFGSKGRGSRVPSAMPLFDYYMHISRPGAQAKGRYDIINTRTHPLSSERYNNTLSQLAEHGFKPGPNMPTQVGSKIILP